MSARLTTPDQILKTALAMEIQAHDFYSGLAQTTSVDFVKQLLEHLQNEESKHVHMIQDMLRRLETGKNIP